MGKHFLWKVFRRTNFQQATQTYEAPARCRAKVLSNWPSSQRETVCRGAIRSEGLLRGYGWYRIACRDLYGKSRHYHRHGQKPGDSSGHSTNSDAPGCRHPSTVANVRASSITSPSYQVTYARQKYHESPRQFNYPDCQGAYSDASELCNPTASLRST